MFVLYALFCAAFVGQIIARSSFSCINQNGDPVDWFIVYKIPKIDSSKVSMVRNGLSFLYMDDSTTGKWTQSNKSINNTNQAVSFTLQQLYSYKSQSDVFHMLYNDEWPDGSVSDDRGHCKGAMLFDNSTGFWLIHSVPKFPSNNSYFYPSSGATYGQSFLCVTFGYSLLPDLSNQMFYYQPWIYSSSLPQYMAQQIPVLSNVLAGKSKSSTPYYSKLNVVSLQGRTFTSFAKHKKWNRELYFDFVAPSLQEDLYTETWQNGQGDIGSNCSGTFTVNNIEYVNLTGLINFSDSKDHSKWAVSSDGGQYVCVGDINRQSGQFKRGGGTLCQQNSPVWTTFRNGVETVEPCPVQVLKWKPDLSGDNFK